MGGINRTRAIPAWCVGLRSSQDCAPVPAARIVDRMARKLTTTIRLDPEDAEALAKAREDGLSASDLLRKGLRIVASRYYQNRRVPSTGLFVSTDPQLGEESPKMGGI